MKILNEGPQDWSGVGIDQGTGTKGSQPINVPVGVVTEVSDELGARLIADFADSPFFKFSAASTQAPGEVSDQQQESGARRGPAGKRKG